jgi:hypothetical protein
MPVRDFTWGLPSSLVFNMGERVMKKQLDREESHGCGYGGGDAGRSSALVEFRFESMDVVNGIDFRRDQIRDFMGQFCLGQACKPTEGVDWKWMRKRAQAEDQEYVLITNLELVSKVYDRVARSQTASLR